MMASSTQPADLLLRSTPPAGPVSELITVTPESAGWDYTSLRVVRLEPGASWSYATNEDEVVLVPLGGSATVTSGGNTWTIGGRASVFDGPLHGLYLPRDSELAVTADSVLELAVCGARAVHRHQPVPIPAGDIAVEIRGAGNAARQINHIVAPPFAADRLLVVEVFTPSGNWSSFPPHKHDVSNLPREAKLEEIYYYRIDPDDGFGFQRLYTADGRIDEAYIIRDGDLLLVPEGYHVFAVAHGYTGYYLNVLAGNETERTMQPADDPAYAWVRGTWNDEMNADVAHWRDIDHRLNAGAGKRR